MFYTLSVAAFLLQPPSWAVSSNRACRKPKTSTIWPITGKISSLVYIHRLARNTNIKVYQSLTNTSGEEKRVTALWNATYTLHLRNAYHLQAVSISLRPYREAAQLFHTPWGNWGLVTFSVLSCPRLTGYPQIRDLSPSGLFISCTQILYSNGPLNISFSTKCILQY